MTTSQREPLLIDKNFNPIVPRNVREFIASHRTANRFVFDKQATVYLAEMVRELPELLMSNAQFAKPQYPEMYVEFDREVYARRAGGLQINPDMKGTDIRQGFLYLGNTVYTLSQPNDSDEALINIFVYDLNTPQEIPIAQFYDEPNFIQAMAVHAHHILGSSAGKYFKRPDNFRERLKMLEEQMHNAGQMTDLDMGKVMEAISIVDPQTIQEAYSMCLRHNVRMVRGFPPLKNTANEPKRVMSIVARGSGDLRLAIACLLLMHRPSKTMYLQAVGPSRTLFKGKLRNYLAHNVVKFSLNPVERIKRVLTYAEGRRAPRRHEVKGHYAHWHRNPLCDHNYERLDETHWLCSKCACLRVWRKPTLRGDASKGFVTKDYAVTANDID